jgi:hypothetical protein
MVQLWATDAISWLGLMLGNTSSVRVLSMSQGAKQAC